MHGYWVTLKWGKKETKRLHRSNLILLIFLRLLVWMYHNRVPIVEALLVVIVCSKRTTFDYDRLDILHCIINNQLLMFQFLLDNTSEKYPEIIQSYDQFLGIIKTLTADRSISTIEIKYWITCQLCISIANRNKEFSCEWKGTFGDRGMRFRFTYFGKSVCHKTVHIKVKAIFHH